MSGSLDLTRGGTYLLALRLPRRATVVVGALGELTFARGVHVYVGSAHGPGGLAARLRRHVVGGGRRHWHLDHLHPHGEVEAVVAGSGRHECSWARWLAERSEVSVPRFGASDCRCGSHLYRLGPLRELRRLVRAAAAELGAVVVPPAQLAGTSKGLMVTGSSELLTR